MDNDEIGQAGLLAGVAVPRGAFPLSLSLFFLSLFGPLGLSMSLGSKTRERESLRGPYRRQASVCICGGGFH